jgi:GTP cyclohydrolase II
LDTVEANHALGFPNDTRSYDMAVAVLKQLGVCAIDLMTNNPQKIAALESHWLRQSIKQVPLMTAVNACNQFYLETKKRKMDHLFDNLI